MTLTLDNGEEMTFALDGDTTYHEATDATRRRRRGRRRRRRSRSMAAAGSIGSGSASAATPDLHRRRRHGRPVRATSARLTDMHLLVIEDDPRLGRLLKRLLEDDRHVVELATDGQSGLEIAEDAPGIECVILDIGLPDISGLEVARRLRAAGSEVDDPHAHRPRHGRRPGDRARRRRRRLPRQAVRVRGAVGPAAGAGRAGRDRRAAGPRPSSSSGRSRSTRRRGG